MANAFFLAAVTDFNWIAAPAKYARIAEALGLRRGAISDIEAARRVGTLIRELIADIGVPLDQVSLQEQDLSHLSKAAMANLACEVNPRSMTEDDFMAILMSVKEDTSEV